MATELRTSLRLLNDSTVLEPEWWQWSIWLDGPPGEVENVTSVTYRLHPTFSSPIRVIKDRTTNFRLIGKGWGEFMITAEAHFKSGGSCKLERWLELRDGAGRRQTEDAGAGGRVPTIFISSSVVDADIVAALTKGLQEQGIEARRAQELSVAAPNLSTSIEETLRASDGVVAIFSDPRSPWVEVEFERARALKIPTFPVVVGKTFVPPATPEEDRFELDHPTRVAPLVDMIAARLKDKLISDD